MVTSNAVNTSLSGQSGTGSFAGTTSPTFTTPILGTPSSGTLSNCTGYVPGNLSSTTGSGAAVLATSPTINTLNVTNEVDISRPGGGGVLGMTSSLSSINIVLDVDSVSKTSINYADGARSYVIDSSGSHQSEIWANGGQVLVIRNGMVVGGATGGDK